MNKLTKMALAGMIAAGTSMAANGDGYKMSICSTDKSKLCHNNKEIFLNGMNIAWWNFSQDVGKDANGKLMTIDENAVRKDLKDLRAAGGNSIRWWLFTNNTMDPSFDPTTHYATGIEEQTIKNVGMVLDIAEEYGIVVDLCLLSFDMMKKDYNSTHDWGGRFDFEANELILKDEAATQAFIDKAVLPLVKAYKNHPALLAWEVFNEPEGMTSTENFGNGWGTELVDIKYIQRVINMTADAIHKEAPTNLVSNGSARFTMTSDKCGKNYYTDAQLLAAGENKYTKGTLDFYQVHYYPEWNPNSASPFHNPYSYYLLDKPMVVGELPGADWTDVNTSGGNLSQDPAGSRQMTIADAYKYAFENGYSGAMGWTLHEEAGNDFYKGAIWSLANSAAALTTIYNLDSTKVKIKDEAVSAGGQNGWMKVTYANTDASEGANLTYKFTTKLTGNKEISFTVKNNSTQDLQYTMALKTNANDKHQAWGWYNGNNYCDVAAGETATCTFPVADFAYWEDDYPITENLGNLAEVIIKMTTGDFSGEVLIDNVLVDGGAIVINNFDTEFDTFSPEQATITKVETYFDGTPATPLSIKATAAVPAAKMNVIGNRIMLSTATMGETSVDVFSLNGNRIATLFRGSLSAGTHAFNMSEMPKGQYIVRVKGAGIAATQPVKIK
ncbi:MAG: cellulase family glycosylhydrolase [Fibrobacter sp.]|nr:cellulase family glycosylhydrolase [Fibrobacter sp.]